MRDKKTNGRVPAYQRIQSAIRRRIESGEIREQLSLQSENLPEFIRSP